jgi:hypothetical protein
MGLLYGYNMYHCRLILITINGWNNDMGFESVLTIGFIIIGCDHYCGLFEWKMMCFGLFGYLLNIFLSSLFLVLILKSIQIHHHHNQIILINIEVFYPIFDFFHSFLPINKIYLLLLLLYYHIFFYYNYFNLYITTY